MKKYLSQSVITICILFVNFHGVAQGDCHTLSIDDSFETKTQSFCTNNVNNYKLDKTGVNKYDQSPIYTIRLKVHVIQYSSTDPRNYTTADIPAMLDIDDQLNSIFADLQPPVLPVISPTLEETDTRIRFSLSPNDIEFVQDPVGWIGLKDLEYTTQASIVNIINSKTIQVTGVTNNLLHPSTQCIKILNSNSNNGFYILDYSNSHYDITTGITTIVFKDDINNISDLTGNINYIWKNNVESYYHNLHNANDKSAIHIYFLRNINSCYQMGYGISYSPYMFAMVNPGTDILTFNGIWYELLAHELGHSLGLAHTFGPSNNNSCGDDGISDTYYPDPNLTAGPCGVNQPYDKCGGGFGVSNNIMGYNSCRNYFSPLQIATMRKILNSSTSIMEKVVESHQATNHDVVITGSNVVWEHREIIGRTLYIETGAKLTIKCRVHFSSDARVVIKPGGKLIIDGGLLTNEYGKIWKGIEVWGTTNQHQYPENNPTYQGYLQLINGGTIENAYNAVTNWKPEDWNKIGGVIVSNGGVFKNNRRDVEFMSYENFNPSNPNTKRNNLSSFTNTDFIADNNAITSSSATNPHVTMWQVYGINFTNCHFTNTRTKALDAPSYKAIQSIDAGYTIGAGCSTLPPLGQSCPTSNLLKSTFTGYQTAIEATGAGTSKTVTVTQADLTNNITGITIDAFNNVSFNRNNISVGSAGYIFAISGTGISIANSTGYIVEENAITKTLSGTTTGIYVNNSGTANNRLYKNTLTGLSNGNNLIGINRDATNALKGLQFLCNTYTSNNRAVNIGNSTSSHGVRSYQGEYSPLKSAGNTFSSNTNSIYNSSISPISYYHNAGTTTPTNNTANVTLYNAGSANACPSSYGGGLILLGLKSGGALDSLENEQQNYKSEYNNLYYNYLSLVDGGNTDDLKSKVENSWSEDVWKLRGNLLEKSPYLSQEILLETAKLGILPNAMMLELCLANPDATKSSNFVNKLNESTNGTFPSYMYTYILNNDKKTVRTQLEGQMTTLQTKLSSTNHFIANITATADEYSYDNTYNTIVRAGNDLSDKVNLIDFFIENNKWSKADSVLQSIRADKKMQENLPLVEDFDQYIAFRASLGERKIAQLNEQEISFLQTLAQKEGRVSSYSRNILCFFYNICYDKNIEESSQKMILQQPTLVELAPALETLTYSVTLYPNPAKELVNLKWEIFDELQNCHYKVVDMNGTVVAQANILENRNELTIDTRNLRDGIYIISIYNKDELKSSRKLVVEKLK